MDRIIHYYEYLGEVLSSEVDFPELFPITTRPASVKIFYGTLPKQLKNAKILQKNNIKIEITPQHCLYNAKNIGRCLVSNGERIIIEHQSNPLHQLAKHQLLGRLFQICLMQRGIFTMHASAVVLESGGCAAFAGPSGIGKSSTAVALSLKGYPLVSEDTIALNYMPNDGIFIPPSNRKIKLWSDVIGYINENKLEEKTLVDVYTNRKNLTKFGFTLPKSSTYTKQTKLKVIYCLEQSDHPSSGFSVEEINGLEKIMYLKDYCFRSEDIVKKLGILEKLFEQYMYLKDNIILKIIKRPNNGALLINELTHILREDFKKLN